MFSSVKWKNNWVGEGTGCGEEDLMDMESLVGLVEAGSRLGPRTEGQEGTQNA